VERKAVGEKGTKESTFSFYFYQTANVSNECQGSACMPILSAILYFLSQHPLWSLLVISLSFLVLGIGLSMLRKHAGWSGLVIVGLLLAMANVFLGHIVNALFLNANGVVGTAAIVHAEQTSSTLNDQYIWDYDAVLRTADGQDVPFAFDTMTASIYPIRNEILIPPEGERFLVKYVPGFPRNVVILSDQSEYGKKLKIDEDFQPVQKAAAQLAFSPDNKAFLDQYRQALQQFIALHRNDADPALIASCEQKLAALAPPQ
jgi:hypothetical protein